MDLDWPVTLALGAGPLVHLPDPLLDEIVWNLFRNGEQDARLLTSVVAKTRAVRFLATKQNGCPAIVAYGHDYSLLIDGKYA
jgi:hypothetical protein